MSRPTIKFSHTYLKLLDNDQKPIDRARLIGTAVVELENLHSSFLQYDTDHGMFNLPEEGLFIMLIFLKPYPGEDSEKNLFTTLRPLTPDKWRWYNRNVGNVFEVKIK
jgi:hypothetical protein